MSLHSTLRVERFRFSIQSHHRRDDQHSRNIRVLLRFFHINFSLLSYNTHRLRAQFELESWILSSQTSLNKLKKKYSLISYLFCNISLLFSHASLLNSVSIGNRRTFTGERASLMKVNNIKNKKKSFYEKEVQDLKQHHQTTSEQEFFCWILNDSHDSLSLPPAAILAMLFANHRDVSTFRTGNFNELFNSSLLCVLCSTGWVEGWSAANVIEWQIAHQHVELQIPHVINAETENQHNWIVPTLAKLEFFTWLVIHMNKS